MFVDAELAAVEIPPGEMKSRSGEVRERMIALIRRALEEDGADVILPMGNSMTPGVIQAKDLAQACGVPVVDGLIAGVRLAETLVLMKTSQSPIAYPKGGGA